MCLGKIIIFSFILLTITIFLPNIKIISIYIYLQNENRKKSQNHWKMLWFLNSNSAKKSSSCSLLSNKTVILAHVFRKKSFLLWYSGFLYHILHHCWMTLSILRFNFDWIDNNTSRNAKYIYPDRPLNVLYVPAFLSDLMYIVYDNKKCW